MSRRVTLRASAHVSRHLHARGMSFEPASGAVRRVAGRLVGPGTVTYRNSVGHAVNADLRDHMERAGFFGAHASRLIRSVASVLQLGDWAIDAGANVGLVASPMSAAVGPSGRVWAVEPLPRNVERLQELKDINHLSQLDILPLALTSSTGTAVLRTSTLLGGSGFGSLVAPWINDGTTVVATATLDELVAQRAPSSPLRLVKIDVEGAEFDLLTGARETLTTHQPLILCEFNDPLLHAAGRSSRELLEAFAEVDYIPSPALSDRRRASLEGRVLDLILLPKRKLLS